MVDGGMLESFLSSRIVITSLVQLPNTVPPTPPPPPPSPSRRGCSASRVLGCFNESNCGADVGKRCLPHTATAYPDSREGCAGACATKGLALAGMEAGGQCFCGPAMPARCNKLPDAACRAPKVLHMCRGEELTDLVCVCKTCESLYIGTQLNSANTKIEREFPYPAAAQRSVDLMLAKMCKECAPSTTWYSRTEATDFCRVHSLKPGPSIQTSSLSSPWRRPVGTLVFF